jgi:hypothetical protein
MVYRGRWQTFIVPGGWDDGQETDLGSVPKSLQGMFSTYGSYTSAVILHDYLWRVAVPNGMITYREADALLRQAMGTLGVLDVRRYAMWAAVRWGSLLTRRGGHKEWHRDALPVIGLTLLLFPLVVFPALANTISTALLTFMEGIMLMVKKLSVWRKPKTQEKDMHIEQGLNPVPPGTAPEKALYESPTEIIASMEVEITDFGDHASVTKHPLFISAREWNIIQERATAMGKTPSEWVRDACMTYAGGAVVPGVGRTAPQIEAPRDLLKDLAEVLGNEPVRATKVPVLLQRLAPQWAPYRTMTGKALRDQLAALGVKVPATNGIFPVDPVTVREALARQAPREGRNQGSENLRST